MEVLWRPAEGGWRPGRCVVGGAHAPGRAARGVRDRDGGAGWGSRVPTVAQGGGSLAGPLAFVGAVFILLQVLTPIHQAISANLGDRTAAWLYDRLTEACVRPPGMGHLEDPKLTSDLTVARDFDLGMTGPPLSISHGLHCERSGRNDRRPLVRVCARRLRMVGADPPGRRVAGDALAAARERDLARSQHRRGAQRAARRRLRVPARRRPAARQGAASLRPRRMDDRPLRQPPHPSARAAVRSDPAAREADAVESAARDRRQCARVLVARERRG